MNPKLYCPVINVRQRSWSFLFKKKKNSLQVLEEMQPTQKYGNKYLEAPKVNKMPEEKRKMGKNFIT